jgi:hypothetical protein
MTPRKCVMGFAIFENYCLYSVLLNYTSLAMNIKSLFGGHL